MLVQRPQDLPVVTAHPCTWCSSNFPSFTLLVVFIPTCLGCLKQCPQTLLDHLKSFKSSDTQSTFHTNEINLHRWDPDIVIYFFNSSNDSSVQPSQNPCYSTCSSQHHHACGKMQNLEPHPMLPHQICTLTKFQVTPEQVKVCEALPNNYQATGIPSLLSLRTVVLNQSYIGKYQRV